VAFLFVRRVRLERTTFDKLALQASLDAKGAPKGWEIAQGLSPINPSPILPVEHNLLPNRVAFLFVRRVRLERTTFDKLALQASLDAAGAPKDEQQPNACHPERAQRIERSPFRLAKTLRLRSG
jgi:hypothetical protein